jgi:hypothetical protein
MTWGGYLNAMTRCIAALTGTKKITADADLAENNSSLPLKKEATGVAHE